jgi:hypothetical protein
MNDIEQRIEALERKNRTLARVLTAVLVAGAGIGVMGARSSDVTDLVKTRRLEIISEAGNATVVLGTVNSGGMVRTQNDANEMLAVVGSTQAGGGAITTYDGTGNKSISFGATNYGTGAISTFSPTGAALVRIVATSTGAGALSTYNDRGEHLLSLSTTDDGAGIITSMARNGIVKASWP